MDQKVNTIRESRWQVLITEALSSGMTKREWCRLHDISIRKFFYWQNKLRKKALLKAETQPKALAAADYPISDEEPAFLELAPPGEISCAEDTAFTRPASPDKATVETLKPELLLAYGGFQILVSHETGEDVLRKVIRVLKNA